MKRRHLTAFSASTLGGRMEDLKWAQKHEQP